MLTMSKQCSSRASSGFDVFRPPELGYGVVRLVIQYCTSGCSQPLGAAVRALLQANPHYMEEEDARPHTVCGI